MKFRKLSSAIQNSRSVIYKVSLRFIDTVADYAVLHGRTSPGFLVRNGNRVLSLMGRAMLTDNSKGDRSRRTEK